MHAFSLHFANASEKKGISQKVSPTVRIHSLTTQSNTINSNTRATEAKDLTVHHSFGWGWDWCKSGSWALQSANAMSWTSPQTLAHKLCITTMAFVTVSSPQILKFMSFSLILLFLAAVVPWSPLPFSFADFRSMPKQPFATLYCFLRATLSVHHLILSSQSLSSRTLYHNITQLPCCKIVLAFLFL